MPIVLREGGFEIKIYFNDHPPPHVHAFKGGGEIKINLDPTVVVQVWNMTKQGAQKAKRVVNEHQKYLLEAWEKIHGRQDVR